MKTISATVLLIGQCVSRRYRALAAKSIIAAHNEKLQVEIKSLRETTDSLSKKLMRLATEKDEGEKRNSAALGHWMKQYETVAARLENIDKFFRWNPEANTMHQDYVQEQRRETERKAAEQKRLAQEREQQERQRQEEQQRREAELAREKEAQRERERVQYMERRSRGMGMGR